MSLVKQNFTISLAKGLDTKTDEKQIIPGKLLLLENGIFTSPTEIRKRNGNQPLSTSILNNSTFTLFNTVPTKIASGNFISSFKEEVVLNDNYNLYSYSEALQTWSYKGKNTICELSVSQIARNRTSLTGTDSAIDPNGIQLFSWIDSGDSNVHVSVVDTATGQTLINNQVIAPAGAGNTFLGKCIYFAGSLFLFYLDNTAGVKLFSTYYVNNVFSTPVVLETDVKTTAGKSNYDICLSNSNLYIAYNTSVGGGSIKVTYIDSSKVHSSITISKTGENADGCITIFTDGTFNLWVGYSNLTSIKAFIVNNALNSTVLAPTSVATYNASNITGVNLSSTQSLFFYSLIGSADSSGKFSNASTSYNTLTLTGTAGTSTVYLNSASLQSKSFLLESDNGALIPYVTVTHDSGLQPTYFLTNFYNISSVALPPANIVAKIAANEGGGVPGRQSLTSVNVLDTNIVQMSLLQQDLLYTSTSTAGTVNSYTQTGVISAQLDFTKTNLVNQVLGDNLHISGGYLSIYDGATVSEHSFHLYPENVALTINTSGGGLTDSSSYGYQVVYEWTDNQGQLHRSNPSPIISGTTGSHSNASQGVLAIPTLRITAKTSVNIVVYRTQANGSVYYRLNLPSSPLANTLTADTVTYTDNFTDAQIAANEQLYTTGGEVGNFAAPAASVQGTYKNRIILIPSDNGYSWWFSKQVIPGSPVEFSDLFVENIGSDGGPITVVAQMDSNLLLFKENTIWYVVGDGPSPSGANNDFTEALKIASDVGCINPQSMVLMPSGLMFKSNKGIYLLSRGLSVTYIGADVEAFNSYEVTSAKLIVDTTQVRFTLANNSTLVYDYYVDQWSVFTNSNAISSILMTNNFTFLRSDGLVLQETPNVFNDNGQFIKLKLITSWLSLAGLEGFQRIYKLLVLGQYFGPHKLLSKVSYDFNPFSTQENYIDAATLLNFNIYGEDATYGLTPIYGGQYPSYQWRVFMARQLCTSIQFSLEDVPVAGNFVDNQGNTQVLTYNEGLSLSSLTLEVGTKKGGNKLPSRNSF